MRKLLAREDILSVFVRRQKLFYPALTACLLVVGCSPGADLAVVPPYDPTVYRLGVDDQVRIVAYGDDKISDDFRISGNGTIAIPLVGSVVAEGQTSEALADTIAEALKSKHIMRTPSVTVEVKAYRQITILGEVVKPGQFPYQPGMTVLTAVAAAGGFTYRAVESRAYVIRQEGKTNVVGRLEPQDYVKPGDVMKVYQRTF
jgi:polysaccharide export outer membrane protein